jgi:hypothetical protein
MKKLILVTATCAVLAFTACKGHGAADNADSGSMSPPDTGAGVKPTDTTGLGKPNKDTMKTPKDDTIPAGNGSGSGGSVTPKHKP